MRALGPVASTSLFAVSLQRNWLGGYGVYPIMIALASVLFTVSTHLPRNLWPKEKEAENRAD